MIFPCGYFTPLSVFTCLKFGYSSPFAHLCGCIMPPRDTLFSFITPGDLGKLAQTSRSIRNTLKHFGERAYPINHLIGEYFSDSINFRLLQARRGTLISGSFALSLMSRTTWVPNNMDIYLRSDFLTEASPSCLKTATSEALISCLARSNS